ncbi:hypothetical protein DNTS_026797 [Danionella cerebrum]|uniref:Keratinocyte differentiation factor 1 n=1 Tax=Danionella cerebrum TaxID=2873325 RepID=A0A553R1B8_9TELE|nr:hypothetical protein DNTS_026797 [Danionella translucida]
MECMSCLSFLAVMFPVVVASWSYDGNVQTAVERVSAPLPKFGPWVRQKGIWSLPVDWPVQAALGNDDYNPGRLFVGTKVESEAFQMAAEGAPRAMSFKASAPKHLPGFDQLSASPWRNFNPGTQIASASWTNSKRTQKEPESNTLKASADDSSYRRTLNTNVFLARRNRFGSFAQKAQSDSNTNPAVVSSGLIFVVKSDSSQGSAGYSAPLEPVKPVSRLAEPSQTSRDAVSTAISQGMSWNRPHDHYMGGTSFSNHPELEEDTELDCVDDDDYDDEGIVPGSNEILLNPQDGSRRNNLQKLFAPMEVGTKQSSFASSGAIVFHNPTDTRPPVNQNPLPNKQFKVNQNSKNVPQATIPYVSSSLVWDPATGTRPPFRPSTGASNPSRDLGFNGAQNNFPASNDINTVRVRLNKPFASSFGPIQAQKSTSAVGGSFPSPKALRDQEQKPGQSVRIPLSSSTPLHYRSAMTQSQLVETQGRCTQCYAIQSRFGQGVIRRSSSMLPSNRQVGKPTNTTDGSGDDVISVVLYLLNQLKGYQTLGKRCKRQTLGEFQVEQPLELSGLPENSQHRKIATFPSIWVTRGWSGLSVVPMENTRSWAGGPIAEGPFRERSVDPEIQHFGVRHKVNKDANGNTTGPETIAFLPIKEEPVSGSCVCGTCASLGSCKKLFCNVLTCGLFRVCRRLPCLVSNENAPVNANVDKQQSSLQNEESFYPDVRIRGVKVDTSVIEDDEHMSLSTSKMEMDSSIYMSTLPEDDFVSGSEVEDVDKLITRKLIEVFSEFEINELAKCTTDSMFLRRTHEISQLISEIVEEHNMEAKEAECRLVREIIRISTRKSKKKPQIRPTDLQRDSGNETWNSKMNSPKSFSSMSDGELQISMERPDDIEARKLRNSSFLFKLRDVQSVEARQPVSRYGEKKGKHPLGVSKKLPSLQKHRCYAAGHGREILTSNDSSCTVYSYVIRPLAVIATV